MADYLEEAAALLRLARDDNERRAELAEEMTGQAPVQDLLQEVNDRRMELAAAFTRLAALHAGFAPAFGVAQVPEGEQADDPDDW